MRKNKLGFTLIEGVVILSILIILVLAGALAYRPIRGKSYDLQEKTIMNALQMALNTYYAKYGVWYGDPPTPSECPINNHPFNLLKDSAPLRQACGVSDPMPPPDGIYWRWSETSGMYGRTKRYHFYCPHFQLGVKGNWFIYVVNDPPLKPGTMMLNQSNGH